MCSEPAPFRLTAIVLSAGQSRLALPLPHRRRNATSGPSLLTRLSGPKCNRLRIEFVEQRLCMFQIRCVEALSEPAVDRCKEVAALGVTALVAAESGEAHRGGEPRLLRSLAAHGGGGFVHPLPPARPHPPRQPAW